jgi:DNA invertase Pin-like site-specific DNA recombinase
MSRRVRCAIYTRKSTEEGLEQRFNSLHAQREACEAFVLSQAGEGWSALTAEYDDGGYSGGNMDRPGLQKLMADIGRGLVDVVVVYKVDRLTRSLADFAKIVEVFDTKGVSFVSVTQAFNTTSSMGRLTLNVLLSFAQFEREVTGERIRDKFAASKAKGLRMGGHPPLGYDIVGGRLALNPAEADRVRGIFRRYLELGSVHALATEGVTAKRWMNRAGEEAGGGLMSPGALRYLLRNPAYRGVTRHKDKQYPDTHPPIIDAPLWDEVQARLAAAGRSTRPDGALQGDERAALAGRLFDDRGNAMVPVHSKRGVKRYRYYLSRPKLTRRGVAGSFPRIPAGALERFLADHVAPRLASSWRPDCEAIDRVVSAMKKIVIADDRMEAEMLSGALSQADLEASVPAEDGARLVRLAFEGRRDQGVLVLRAPGERAEPPRNMNRALIRAVVLARVWARDLEAGAVASIKALARGEGLCNHYTSRLLPLAYLAPDLTDAILTGRQPRNLTLAALTSEPLPLDWAAQRRRFEQLG